MDPLLISVIMAIIGAFLSKKNGAEDGEAALVGAAAGLGSYYVMTETEWGKALIGQTDTEWVDSGKIDADGKKIYVPKDSTVNTDANGNVVVKSDGSWWNGGSSTVADVLKDWGPAGTAAVIGTTGVAASGDIDKYLPWIIGGLVVFMVLK